MVRGVRANGIPQSSLFRNGNCFASQVPTAAASLNLPYLGMETGEFWVVDTGRRAQSSLFRNGNYSLHGNKPIYTFSQSSLFRNGNRIRLTSSLSSAGLNLPYLGMATELYTGAVIPRYCSIFLI